MNKILLPIVILLAGLAAMAGLVKSGSAEQRVEPTLAVVQVNTLKATQAAHSVLIKGSGVVLPSKQVNIVPQVSGKIVSVADNLKPGSHLQKGDVLARIEQADYLLGVQQEKNRVEQAKLNLKIEEQRQNDAQREWELLGNEGKAPELASRLPQLELAKSAVKAAEAGLERAQLALARTTIRAPFDSMVKMEQLEEGQVVGGAAVATLQGTEQFWVRVSIPTSELMFVAIPDINAEEGSKVDVFFSPNPNQSIHKSGQVLGLESELDSQARTATLLIGIDQPLGGDFPLLLGSFVQVEIQGPQKDNIIELPASALQEGSFVLIADEDDKLAKQEVQVGWYSEKSVFITSGLQEGTQVITTNMSLPIYGSPLEILNSVE